MVASPSASIPKADPSVSGTQTLDFRPIARARLHFDVARQVAETIISGGLSVGDVLPSEQDLAGRFGVSRTVIRAAVGLLEIQGLVDVSHGKRTAVRPQSDWNVLDPTILELFAHAGRLPSLINDIFHTRLALEVAAAQEAAERATPEMIAALATICDEMDDVLKDAGSFSYDQYHRCDGAFHRLLADASANLVLARVLGNLAEAFGTISGFNPIRFEELETAKRFHHTIYEAVRSGDPAAAGQAMREHILWAWHRWDSVE
jgi:GntR family transcriptional repressor for pyruvate dehydrogenase complex